MRNVKSLVRLSFGLMLCLISIFVSCKNPSSAGNQGKNPAPAPAPSPDAPEKADLIANVGVVSENGKEFAFTTVTTNVKGATRVFVVIKNGEFDLDDIKVSGTFNGQALKFADIEEWSRTAASSELQGVDATEKEVTIEVKLGNKVDSRSFKIRMLDEETLEELNLETFTIGESTNAIALATKGGSFRIYDKNSNKVKFTATFNKDVTKAILIENEKEKTVSPTEADKKKVEVEIEFAKDEVKQLAFIFQAEGCKDYRIKTFTLTFTNKANFGVQVRAGRAIDLSEETLFSGKVEIPQCSVVDPEIVISASLNRGARITKVTIDDADITVKKENEDTDRETTSATWKLDPPFANPNEEKTVRVRVEGASVQLNESTNQYEATPCEPLNFEVKLTFLQDIKAKLEINPGDGWIDIKDGHRLYDQDVTVRVTAEEDDLEEVEVKGTDADGKTPEVSIDGKVATIAIKLKDDLVKPSKFKVILKAKDKANTTKAFSLRYSATNDPLTIGGASFGPGELQVDADRKYIMDDDKALKMTGTKLRAWILAGQSCKDITSIKINGTEALDQTNIGDDQVVQSCVVTKSSGPGGTSVNAVFVFGGDSIQVGKVYELSIVMEGMSNDNKPLTACQPIPLKFKLPNYGNDNTNWRKESVSDDAPKLTVVSFTRHAKRKSLEFFNDYDTTAIKAFLNPENPKATVEGFWYDYSLGGAEKTKILNGDKTTYQKHYLTFTEGTGVETGVNSKWCFSLDFNSPDMAGKSIGVVLYVISADGSKINKDGANEWAPGYDKPFEISFRRTHGYFGYDADIKQSNVREFASDIEISKAQIHDNKVYFLFATYSWDPLTTYSLFTADDQATPESKILNLAKLEGKDHWYKFALDVSDLDLSGTTEKEVSIPILMNWKKAGEEFNEVVFTRKFKVKLVA